MRSPIAHGARDPGSRKVYHLAILLPIVALAFALRLYRLSDIDIRFDAASALQQASAIANGELLGFAQYSGSVIQHPPLFLYLLALPMLLSREFLAVAAFHVMLDVCAIPVIYVAAARRQWPVAAAVGALLLATNPWAAQFARNLGIVTPPLFAALCLWGLLEGVAGRRWGWALASVSAVLGLAAHLSGAYLLIVVTACVLIFRARVSWRALAVGLIPFAVLAAVYASTNGAAVLALITGATPSSNSSGAIAWQPLAVQFALWTSGGMHLSDLTSVSYPDWLQHPALVWSWLDVAQIGLLLTGLVIASGLLPKRLLSNIATQRVLFVAWLLPVALISFGSRAPGIHYVIPMQPASALLMGIAAQTLFASVTHRSATYGRWSIALITLGAFMIGAWQSFNTLRFAAFSGERPVAISPARPLLALADLAKRTRAGGIVEDVIIVANGDNLPWDENIVSIDAALSGVPHRFFNGRNDGMILRSSDTHYIFLPNTEPAFERLRELAGTRFTSTVIPVRLSSTVMSSYRYVVAGPADTGRFETRDNAQWEHGLALRGVQWQRNETAAILRTLFVVNKAGQPNANYHWFHQIYAGGKAIQQTDGQGVHPFYWRVGDVIVNEFVIPIGATDRLTTPVVARIGSYPYPQDGTRISVTLSYGKVTDSVDVMLME